MAWLFSTGHAADLVLLVMVIEAIVLISVRRLPKRAIVAAALPGMFLVGAVRAALVQAEWPWVAILLLLAWPAHLWDLWQRNNSSGA